MKFIKKIIRKLLHGYRVDSQSYINYLRSKGMKIGDNVHFVAPTQTVIDVTRPWMISIGNNVTITQGVTIITHGFDWIVLKNVYGAILGSAGGVKISDNVFIGINSTILKGVTIGNNVIIGANSLVTKNIPDNVVASGNPCKILMSLDDYYKKRCAAQIGEDTELVRMYRECYGREPDEGALHEFFWLFSNDPNSLNERYISMMKLGGSFEKSSEALKMNNKMFEDQDSFLKSIK